MLARIAHHPRALAAGGLLVLLCVLAAALSGFYVLIALPLLVMYAALLITNWRLMFWGMIAAIPLSVDLGFLGLPLSTSLPDEPMMWGFLGLGLLLAAANPFRMPRWWWQHPLMLVIMLQLIWTLVSLVYSQAPLLSLKFVLAKGWFLFSFMVLPVFIFREKADFRRGFVLFLSTLLFTMVIILYRHYRMSFDFLLPNAAIGFLYYNRVEYSTVLSMFYPLVIIAWQLVPQEQKRLRMLLLGIIILFLPAIYFTYARAAIMALIFAFGISFAIRRRFVQWVMPAFYGVIISVIVFMVRDNKYYDYRPNFNRTYMHTSVADHIVATFRGEDLSSMERLYRWIAGARMSQVHPIVGYGPNTFYDHYKGYAVTAFRTWVSRNPERSTTHNYFLFMLVEQGWPALILYGILVMVFFVQAQKVYHRFQDRFYKKITVGLAMMFAAGFINNFFSELIETHKVGALFYFAIALLIILDRKSKEMSYVS